LETRFVRVQVCGSIVVEDDDGRRLEAELPSRQGRVLFAFLVLRRSRPVPRSEIVDALWPAGGPEDPEAALNALISRLRRVFGTDRVEGRGNVRLRLDPVSVDIEDADEAICRAESAVAQGQWERAWAASLVAMFVAERGFLPGEDALWVDEVRRQLDQMRLRALETYGEAGLGLGGTERAAARRAGRTLVADAPLRESGHRLLMRALVAEGNPAEALRAYEQLRCDLRDELGISPSPATEKLYRELLA
jgi:SARP family transcriptional regulator, regulator of embCAB operon